METGYGFNVIRNDTEMPQQQGESHFVGAMVLHFLLGLLSLQIKKHIYP